MKVLFLAAHSKLVATSVIKVYQFMPLLEKRGIRCKAICFTPAFLYRIRLAAVTNKVLLPVYYLSSNIVRILKTLWAISIASRFDIVFVQEPIIPLGLERLLKLVNNNIIFLFTDAVFLKKQAGDSFIEGHRKDVLAIYWERLARVAKICLAENEYNKSAVSKFCKNIDKITGPIDTERYFFVKDKKIDDIIVIGWTGSFFTTKYLYEIAGALKLISQKYNVVLRLIGARKDFNIPGVKSEIIDWSYDAELSWLKTFDVGITPLVDDAWVKGKASYKLLQYMSMGIPTVASPVGFSAEMIQDGVNGFLAGTDSEWVEKFSILIDDAELREKIRKNARDTIQENYSLSKTVEKLSGIFENILKIT